GARLPEAAFLHVPVDAGAVRVHLAEASRGRDAAGVGGALVDPHRIAMAAGLLGFRTLGEQFHRRRAGRSLEFGGLALFRLFRQDCPALVLLPLGVRYASLLFEAFRFRGAALLLHALRFRGMPLLLEAARIRFLAVLVAAL